MKNAFPAKSNRRRLTAVHLALAVLLGLTGCGRPANPGWQGYLEGEFVYVAAPLAGQLETLSVQRGQRVQAGAPLFALDRQAELDQEHQAAAQLEAARSRLADLTKGQRPTEIAALQARLDQARAAARLSGLEFARQQQLHAARVSSAENYDRARLSHERDQAAVQELNAQLDTARLGARPDAIAAAAAEISSAQAAFARTQWAVAQTAQPAPAAGLVYDTLYRPGEYVAAAHPVVVLLPPANFKVRFYVPEKQFGALRAGEALSVQVDGVGHPLVARISYLSPAPEYTPPVLYNRDNRAKLSFMVEAVFAPQDAVHLHPGQPVSVLPAPSEP